MSLHSHSRCWLHLVWSTLDREKTLANTHRPRISRHLHEYAHSKGLFIKTNYVNADHVHALIDLPTKMSIEGVAQLLKGSSSHWINANNLVHGRFAWGRGYGAFSVSESRLGEVTQYIADQAEHHRVRTFSEELKELVERHGLLWHEK